MDDVTGADMPEISPLPPEGASFVAVPEMLAMANPFGQQDCVSMDLVREVNLSQLADEIGAAAGVQVQLTVANPEPGKHHLNRTLPNRLHVLPPIPEQVLREVISAHEPDADYGLTEEQRERFALLEKLRQDKKLTSAEMAQALIVALSER